jgi:glycosyltransferase involved in cell wall biosynthesis
MPILKDKHFSQRLREIISNKRYDYIVVRYIPTLIQGSIPLGNNIIIDIDDLPEQTYQWLAEKEKVPILKNLRYLQAVLLEKASRIHTKKLVKNVNHVFLANKNQIALFSNASYLPNIPYPFFHKNGKKQQEEKKQQGWYKLLFVGNLSWGPNIFGIGYFLNNIWPVILEKLPCIYFDIVGSYLQEEKKIQWQSHRQVNVIGFVPDLIDEYESTDVVIAPIYQGAGTNIKVLEALYMNIPCVITQYACRGFEDILIDKQNVLIAQTDIEFADKVITVLKDKNLNTYIKMNAYKTIENNFSYNSFRQAVHEHIH